MCIFHAFSLVAGIAAAKAAAYSQLEVVRASMLSRHVKSGGAKVLQLGGNTKDLYYYPSGTVQVTVVGPDENAALWETAGMNAGGYMKMFILYETSFNEAFINPNIVNII